MKKSIQDTLFRITAAGLGAATLGSALFFTLLGGTIVNTANQTAQQASSKRHNEAGTDVSSS